ncbi:MAG: hypothetical protein FWG25_11235, partial [Promicromonosporaceae bacterium]|nr:hypothetical protein [Promicromonosporaceae bacterium]
IAWRGLDNPLYYLHTDGTPRQTLDMTGAGNTLDFRQVRVIQMALDSLRYWAQEIGVDGFRFDLAVTLGRGPYGFDPNHPFLVALQTDPTLSGLKLVMEPWDVGPAGWQTGSFPAPLGEWNDRFRDAVRGFWLASPAVGVLGRPMEGIRELATRLAGSADLFGESDPPLIRGPVASVNYVTSHDGFTMADLVSYNFKHNLANGEDNRDGTNNNLSWNCGVEGKITPEDTTILKKFPEVVPRRHRQQRNLLAMLLLAAGTPLITAGDEFLRSQDGNNNGYAQDNEISWVNWDRDADAENMLATTRFLLGLRHEHRALRADSFYLGAPRPGEPFIDLLWYDEYGRPMSRTTWDEPGRRVIQMLRPGPGSEDSDVLLVINGDLGPLEVKLPATLPGAGPWVKVWSSAWDTPVDQVSVPISRNETDDAHGPLFQTGPEGEVLTRTVQIPVVQPGGQIIRERLQARIPRAELGALADTHPDTVQLLELNVQVFVAHRPVRH